MYCLEAQDSGGTALAQKCFDLGFVNYETGSSSTVDGFKFMLPYPTGVARIVLKKGALELAVKVVSAHSPVVSVTYPNGGETWVASGSHTITWDASDLDGNTLTFNVFYSPDGSQWIPLGSNITDKQLTVDSSEIPGSTSASIKVMASDGINTTTDVSDAPFTVGSKPPQATILSPEGNGNAVNGASILLQGSGYDLEDGNLADPALTWLSNLDGNLGNGARVLATLSPGLHTITLRATDSNGNQGVSKITINVQSCYPLTLTHIGQGADPIASPAASTICPDGNYLAGEQINLSDAAPDPGWAIAGWAGTNDDSAVAPSNSLVMPDSATLVKVVYISSYYFVYQPLIQK